MASALSYRQNCACACKTLQAQRGQTHGAGCVRQWFRTAELLEERRYENWSTHTHWCNNSEPDWTDARGPVPRLWMHSTEVRGGGGGGGGASLEEWDTTTVAVTRYQTWISIPHMVACAELPQRQILCPSMKFVYQCVV